jgi:hypothetical protein
MTAEDAGRAAAGRLNNLPADVDASLRNKLASEQAKQNRRQAALHQLLSHLNQWIMELPAKAVLVSADAATVELKNGVKLGQAIELLRDQIKAQRQHLEAVKRAPLPLTDQKALATDYVVKLMNQARPTVNVVADQLRVGLRGDIASAEAGLGGARRIVRCV